VPARGLSAIAIATTVSLVALVAPAFAQTGGGTICCGGGQSGGGGSVGEQQPTVFSWVLAAGPGGGIGRPSGKSCGPWQVANGFVPSGLEGSLVQAVFPGEYTTDGRTYRKWYRDCEGEGQVAWVPDATPEDLAELAVQEVERLLPAPSPVMSPDVGVGGFVGLETWMQVVAEADVSATAGPLPNGLSATTTAQASHLVWEPGDGEVIECALWGALPTGRDIELEREAPCGWWPQFPSAPQFNGGHDDLAFHGTVTIIWEVSWTATNGTGGDLDELRSTVPFTYQVREIQTIGEQR
jgi:hypothetical protein